MMTPSRDQIGSNVSLLPLANLMWGVREVAIWSVGHSHKLNRAKMSSDSLLDGVDYEETITSVMAPLGMSMFSRQ
jgi:hypothetical protein